MSELDQRQKAIDVYLGRAPASELDGMKKLAAQEQKATAHAAHVVMRPCSDGIERAVPEHILKAERKDGVRREFRQDRDRLGEHIQGWFCPAPQKPQEVVDQEKITRTPWRYDFITETFVPDGRPMMPPEMARVNDKLSAGDPRRAVYTEQGWVWPRAVPIEQQPERKDLVSPRGFPMTRSALDHIGANE